MYRPPRTAGTPSNSKSSAGCHARDSFDLGELQARLGGADWIDDTEFAAYGLDEQAITGLRQWAQTWADDIGERLQELETPHED